MGLARFVLFTLLALGAAFLGGVAWFGLPGAAPAATTSAASAPHVAVLAASRLLRAGGLLKPEDIAAINVPPDAIPPGARRDTPAARAELVGALVRRTLAADAPIGPDDVLRPGDHGFLAAVLEPGRRATTIGVDAISGSAGLIWPGDRVDVILTQQLEDPALPPGRRVAAETLVAAVRVIAIDQQLLQGATSPAAAPQVHTVTLEVTPEQAERIAVATRLGHLSLDVRAAAHDAADTRKPAPPVWGSDVTAALSAERAPNAAMVRLYRGPDDGREFRF